MSDIASESATRELLNKLSLQLAEMESAAAIDINRAEENLENYRFHRWERFKEEARPLVAQREALIDALAAEVSQRPSKVIFP